MTMHAIDPDARERALQRLHERNRKATHRLIAVVLLGCWAVSSGFGLLVWALSEVRL